MDSLVAIPVLSRIATSPPSPRTWNGRPRLSVVVVNYLHWEDTARLVWQLKQSSAAREGLAEIIIVDNHSPRHPVISRLRRTEGVSLRRWKKNKGFARAINEGCRLSRGDWFLLLNPDTTVPPGFLDDVLAHAESLPPRVGIVGFRLHDEDGSWQLSTGRFPDLFSTLTRLLLPRRLRKYTAPSENRRCEVDWVSGCCLLVRRECLIELGGLDRDFFLYYEDVDLCRRAKQHGWAVCFDPTMAIVHHRPLHARRVPPHLRLITRHALLTYARKHWPSWHLSILGRVIRLETLARRTLAWLSGDTTAAQIFHQLDRLVVDFLHHEYSRASCRLNTVVQEQEERRQTALLPVLGRTSSIPVVEEIPG